MKYKLMSKRLKRWSFCSLTFVVVASRKLSFILVVMNSYSTMLRKYRYTFFTRTMCNMEKCNMSNLNINILRHEYADNK